MKKTFDCVEMKRQIQEKQQKILAGLSAEEISKVMQEAISSDPLLKSIWESSRRLPSLESPVKDEK